MDVVGGTGQSAGARRDDRRGRSRTRAAWRPPVSRREAKGAGSFLAATGNTGSGVQPTSKRLDGRGPLYLQQILDARPGESEMRDGSVRQVWTPRNRVAGLSPWGLSNNHQGVRNQGDCSTG